MAEILGDTLVCERRDRRRTDARRPGRAAGDRGRRDDPHNRQFRHHHQATLTVWRSNDNEEQLAELLLNGMRLPLWNDRDTM